MPDKALPFHCYSPSTLQRIQPRPVRNDCNQKFRIRSVFAPSGTQYESLRITRRLEQLQNLQPLFRPWAADVLKDLLEIPLKSFQAWTHPAIYNCKGFCQSAAVLYFRETRTIWAEVLAALSLFYESVLMTAVCQICFILNNKQLPKLSVDSSLIWIALAKRFLSFHSTWESSLSMILSERFRLLFLPSSLLSYVDQKILPLPCTNSSKVQTRLPKSSRGVLNGNTNNLTTEL